MTRFFFGSALVGALALLAFALPSASQAEVVVLHSTENGDTTQIASFSSAQCRRAKTKKALLQFTATAKKGGFRLSVDIFRGLASYNPLVYGSDGDSQFTVAGGGSSWSNLNRPPDAPPGGGIAFNAKRTRMGLGFSPAFNPSISDPVSVAGGLTCKYPKKKKKKRR